MATVIVLDASSFGPGRPPAVATGAVPQTAMCDGSRRQAGGRHGGWRLRRPRSSWLGAGAGDIDEGGGKGGFGGGGGEGDGGSIGCGGRRWRGRWRGQGRG
jgi:hypothetical protein